MTAPARPDTIASYWRQARKLWQDGVPPHGPTCPDLPCADLRLFLAFKRPPIRIGRHAFSTFAPITREARDAS